MAVHLCVVFNVLFIYIGVVPRTNLVLDAPISFHAADDEVALQWKKRLFTLMQGQHDQAKGRAQVAYRSA